MNENEQAIVDFYLETDAQVIKLYVSETDKELTVKKNLHKE